MADFTTYDAVINDGSTDIGLIYEGRDPELVRNTSSVPLRAVRQDTGNNPNEIRPEQGDIFSQSDFSYGANQQYFHHPKSDPSKYFSSEGFDISIPGKLKHLRKMAVAKSHASLGYIEIFGGVPYLSGGNNDVFRGNGSFPGTWTAEDPLNGEAGVTTTNMCTDGETLFLACYSNGIHARVAGTWDHYQIGGVDTNVGTVFNVFWLKDRLIATGDTGRSLYELVDDATPDPIITLPVNWAFYDVFEAGPYLYACAVSNDDQSAIYHFGLNSAGSALESKGRTPMPKGQLARSGAGYLGTIHIGGGKQNSGGGYNPIVYIAEANQDGSLNLAKLAEADGTQSSVLLVDKVFPRGEDVLFSWSLHSSSATGLRSGIAVHHLGRDAFAHHLAEDSPGAAHRIQDIAYYKGRIMFGALTTGVLYEDLSTYVPTATLTSSLADWNNAGLKTWNKVDVAHKPLPASTSIDYDYSLLHPEENTWVDTGSDSTGTGTTGYSARITGATSRQLAFRMTSTAATSVAPEIQNFSIRSDPYVTPGEFKLTRYVRISYKDRKDSQGPEIQKNPRTYRNTLMNLLYSYVTLYEDDGTWNVRVEGIREVVPKLPLQHSTSGDPHKDYFLLAMEFVGTKTS